MIADKNTNGLQKFGVNMHTANFKKDYVLV